MIVMENDIQHLGMDKTREMHFFKIHYKIVTIIVIIINISTLDSLIVHISLMFYNINNKKLISFVTTTASA